MRIERTAGRDHLVLTPLDALPLPPSLVALRTQVAQRLPRTDIPDPVLEIHARTGFADAFTHISERNARVEDLAVSICAVLIAEACNIGLEPVVRPNVPGSDTWPATVGPTELRAIRDHRSGQRLAGRGSEQDRPGAGLGRR